MIDSVINSEISLDIFILSEKNNITLIDIWLLALRFNIPIIMITSTVFMENKKNVFVTHGSDDNTYIVIRQHGVLPNKVTKYSLVGVMEGKKANYIFDFENFPENIQEEINNELQTVPDDRLTKLITTVKKPKKLKLKKKE